MPSFAETVDAFVASRDFDQATLSRLAFWTNEFGDRSITEISADDVDQAIVRLAARGQLKPYKNQQCRPAGKPLAPSSINRYISQLGSIFKYARRLRLVPRSFVSPTLNIERLPEPYDPDRYLRPEDVERLLKVCKVVDTKWQKMSALIVLAHHTGLRRGSLMSLRWSDIDFQQRTANVLRTKNGQPIVAALSHRAVMELKKLPGKHPDEYVFAGRTGRPFEFRSLWLRLTEEAGLKGRNFHQLRHGCGFMLASNGVNQATVMQIMGHRTLTASARYMHSNVDDRKQVIDKVFG